MSAREAKIGYVTLGGWESTAYVTCDAGEMTAEGVNKHSDASVSVVWDSRLEAWMEIPATSHTRPTGQLSPTSDTTARNTKQKPSNGRTRGTA